MSESLQDAIRRYLGELRLDVTEERVVNYIVRELRLGRRLSEIIQDAYVANRVGKEQVGHLIENTEIIETVEAELDRAFTERDFKFVE